jgi:hypothetical protein
MNGHHQYVVKGVHMAAVNVVVSALIESRLKRKGAYLRLSYPSIHSSIHPSSIVDLMHPYDSSIYPL